MDRAPISLGRAAFQRSFPFGFVVGRDGTFEVVGAGLARRIAEETHPDIAFEVVQPLTGGLAAASKKCGTIVCLRVAADGLELKGEVLCLDGGERYAVLATPVVRTLDEARESGLQLLDFPPHDPTPDRLLSMQAASTALSDARALSEKLETALTEARAAVEAKSRFLAVMSHELRTPMNGVGSMVDLLMGTELVDEQREVLSTIDLCARTLHVLVDDILDYSKLEADGVELESIPFDPVAVAEQAARLFEVSAQERGVEVSVELRPGVPRRILGDPHRVRQVLSNLVGNAVKFTEEGSVTLVLARSGERLSATVVDTGVGIPESAQPTLFEPFTQADVSTTRNHGGTGLGLTISRELARLMGGDVSLVESSERGTTFRFDFDFEHAEALAATSEADPCPARPSGIDDLAGRSVLVVEDNPTNRLVAQRLLEKLGVAVTLAEDGAQAIEEVADQPFDLVLMDLMMPNVDGATAARAIRQLDVEWRGLPIIAFTAGAFDEDREVAASAGMCGFLQKPVRLEQLEAVLLEHIDVHGHAA